MLYNFLIVLVAYLALSVSGLALPNNVTPNPAKRWLDVPTTCGIVEKFYYDKAENWRESDTDGYAKNFSIAHRAEIESNPGGFVAVLGIKGLGDPEFTCRHDGSDSNCEPQFCANPHLNSKPKDEIRRIWQLVQSVRHFHGFLLGLSEALSSSAISAALIKDQLVEKFYWSIKADAYIVEKEVLNGLAVVFNMVAATAGWSSPAVGFLKGGAAALVNGLSGGVQPLFTPEKDEKITKAGAMGELLDGKVTNWTQDLISANNELMKGHNFGETGDLLSYLRNGSFLNFPGVDIPAVSKYLNGLLRGVVVNALWRSQRVFILGGAACGDNQGIGHGPKEASYCHNGKAYYLYALRPESKSLVGKLGWRPRGMQAPPGLKYLSTLVSSSLTVADIIASSVAAHEAGNYNVTSDIRTQLGNEAIQQHGTDGLIKQGPGVQGIFNLPVCNIEQIVLSDNKCKHRTLVPYGKHHSSPIWLDPHYRPLKTLCSGSEEETSKFLKAANLDQDEFWYNPGRSIHGVDGVKC